MGCVTCRGASGTWWKFPRSLKDTTVLFLHVQVNVEVLQIVFKCSHVLLGALSHCQDVYAGVKLPIFFFKCHQHIWFLALDFWTGSTPNIAGGLPRAFHLGWCPTGRESNSGKRRHPSNVWYRDLDKMIAVRDACPGVGISGPGSFSRGRFWIQSLWFTVVCSSSPFGTIDFRGP